MSSDNVLHDTICYVYHLFIGFCTEYSFGGNVIQQNFKANCTKFTHNPCPSSYPSTDAYKCKIALFVFRQLQFSETTLSAIAIS